MQTKRTSLLAALVALALVALFASACSPSYDCQPTQATEFYQLNTNEFGLMVFVGTPQEGYVDPLTLAQVRAIANTTVYVRRVFNQQYELCSTPAKTKAP